MLLLATPRLRRVSQRRATGRHAQLERGILLALQHSGEVLDAVVLDAVGRQLKGLQRTIAAQHARQSGRPIPCDLVAADIESRTAERAPHLARSSV